MKKVVFIALAAIILLGTFAYFYTMRETTDYASQAPEISLSMTDLLLKAESDTAGLNMMKNKLIRVNGATVKSAQHDSMMSVLTLGQSDGSTDVICQFDPRHNQDAKTIQTGQTIDIQGIFINYIVDTDLGLGNTIQLNYCSISKQNQ